MAPDTTEIIEKDLPPPPEPKIENAKDKRYVIDDTKYNANTYQI